MPPATDSAAAAGPAAVSSIEAEGTLEERRARNLRNEVLEIAASRMRRRLEESVAEDPDVASLLERVVSRELDPASAATELLRERDLDG